MIEWSPREDTQRIPSRCLSTWTPDDKFDWRLEVREFLGGGDRRLGEVVLRGSFDGTLTLAILDEAFEEGAIA